MVEGQAGNDTMVFNGSNASESIGVSANGSRVRLARDVGNVTMDMSGIEVINLSALGGSDTISVNDLTGTDVNVLNLNLAGVSGSATGDNLSDTVVVNGSNGDDNIQIAVTGSATDPASRSSGLPAFVAVNITAAREAASDQLTVNALERAVNDTIGANAVKNLVSAGGCQGSDLTLKTAAPGMTTILRQPGERPSSIGGSRQRRGPDAGALGDDTFICQNLGDGGSDVVEWRGREPTRCTSTAPIPQSENF